MLIEGVDHILKERCWTDNGLWNTHFSGRNAEAENGSRNCQPQVATLQNKEDSHSGNDTPLLEIFDTIPIIKVSP